MSRREESIVYNGKKVGTYLQRRNVTGGEPYLDVTLNKNADPGQVLSILDHLLTVSGADYVSIRDFLYYPNVRDYIQRNPRVFVESGLIPESILRIPDLLKIFRDFVEGRRSLPSQGEGSFLHDYWVKYTPDYLQRSREQDPNPTITLLMYGQENAIKRNLIYPRSLRNYTSMEQFRTPDSQTLEVTPEERELIRGTTESERIIETGNFIQIDDDYYLPVTRYGLGMSRGTYYFRDKEPTREYCGTFYYFEPDSDVLLNLGNFQRYPNKLAAAKALLPQLNDYDNIQEKLQEAIDEVIVAIRGFAPSQMVGSSTRAYDDDTLDLLFNEFLRLLDGIPSPYLDLDTNLEDSNGEYYEYIYAAEDLLDQPLCEATRALGIDTLVLDRMAGKRRLVAEVMDSRPRKESFDNLVWLQVTD